MSTKTNSPQQGYSGAIAGQNITEADAQALCEFAVRQSAEQFVRSVFTTKLRNPLNRISKRIAKIEQAAQRRVK
jgi:hypothetical protein